MGTQTEIVKKIGSSPDSVKQAILKDGKPGSGAQVDHRNEVVGVPEAEATSDDGR
jgi:hypothetical protein